MYFVKCEMKNSIKECIDLLKKGLLISVDCCFISTILINVNPFRCSILLTQFHLQIKKPTFSRTARRSCNDFLCFLTDGPFV